jgi:Mrp family chromosome partitioning ATPase
VPPALAADTVAQLKRVGGRVLGVILNDVPVDPSAPYARSRYYDDSEKKPASS